MVLYKRGEKGISKNRINDNFPLNNIIFINSDSNSKQLTLKDTVQIK